jgi:hypothetical protein
MERKPYAALVPYLLRELYTPSAAWDVPPSFAEAAALDAQARASYRDGAYARSAESFVRAAAALHGDLGARFQSAAAADRRGLYQNAAAAWVLAGEPDVGRAALERLQQQGAASEDEVLEALRFLGREH